MISMGVRRSLRTLLRLATAVVGSILKEGLNKSILGRFKSAMQKTSFYVPAHYQWLTPENGSTYLCRREPLTCADFP